MKKGIDLSYSNSDSPTTGIKWANMSRDKRVRVIEASIELYSSDIDLRVNDAQDNGQVSITINSVIEINDRGSFMLNLEEYLKRNVDFGINLWHEAIGDKSSLRNLRGIEVLS